MTTHSVSNVWMNKYHNYQLCIERETDCVLFYHHESDWIHTYTSSDQVLTTALHHGPPWRKKHSQRDFLSNMSPNCCSTWSRVPQFVSVTEKQAETHLSQLSPWFIHLCLQEKDMKKKKKKIMWCTNNNRAQSPLICSVFSWCPPTWWNWMWNIVLCMLSLKQFDQHSHINN